MSEVFDVESIMDKVYDLLSDSESGINYQIGLIESSKSDRDTARGLGGTSLKTIDLDNGIFYFWPKRIKNISPYIVINPLDHITNDDDVDTVTIAVYIVFRDVADTFEPERRLLRYIKALRQVLLHKKFSGYFFSTAINTLGYESFQFPEDIGKSATYSAGISITGSITNEGR